MSKLTYNNIANNWDLWCEYADPNGTFTEDEFYNMSVDEKVDLQIECFGEEDHEDHEDHEEN